MQRRLLADAVHGDHEGAVGDPVGDDHPLPERLGVEVGVVGLGADRGRVDQHLGAGEAVGAGDLREPLVPAGRQPELRLAEGDQREGARAGRAGPEVVVLVVAGGDRDVELAGAADQLAVGGDDDRGVVAEPVRRRRPARRARRGRGRRSPPPSRRRTGGSARRAVPPARPRGLRPGRVDGEVGRRVSSCRQTRRAPSPAASRSRRRAPPGARRDRGASAAGRRRSGTARARAGGSARASRRRRSLRSAAAPPSTDCRPGRIATVLGPPCGQSCRKG